MVWETDRATVIETEPGNYEEVGTTMRQGRTFIDLNRKDILLIMDTLKKAVVSGLCDSWDEVEDIGFIVQQLDYLFEEWNSEHMGSIMDPIEEEPTMEEAPM